MEQKTVEEVLEITMGILNGIMVPASLVEQIGIPVHHAIQNLNECVKAIRAAKAQADEPEEGENDVRSE